MAGLGGRAGAAAGSGVQVGTGSSISGPYQKGIASATAPPRYLARRSAVLLSSSVMPCGRVRPENHTMRCDASAFSSLLACACISQRSPTATAGPQAAVSGPGLRPVNDQTTSGTSSAARYALAAATP